MRPFAKKKLRVPLSCARSFFFFYSGSLRDLSLIISEWFQKSSGEEGFCGNFFFFFFIFIFIFFFDSSFSFFSELMVPFANISMLPSGFDPLTLVLEVRSLTDVATTASDLKQQHHTLYSTPVREQNGAIR